MIGGLYVVTRTFDKIVFTTKSSKPLTHTQGFIQWSADKILFAVLFRTGSWLVCSEIMGLPQRFDDENCSQSKGSPWKQSSIRHNGSRSLEKVAFEIPCIWLTYALPKAKQRFGKELCLCCCNTWKKQMTCVTPKWASSTLWPSRERVEVPITQPGVQSQNPQWQRWWKAVPVLGRDGARSPGQSGHQECIDLSLRGRKAPKYSLGGIATEGKLSSCPIQELLLYLRSKRKEGFFRFLENPKPWISASLKRSPYIHLMSR